MKNELILSAKGLKVIGEISGLPIVLVDSVNIELGLGEVLAIVGESGAGKSLATMSLVDLLPGENIRMDADELIYGGLDYTNASKRMMRELRRKEISIIFQDPLAALNPIMKIGKQVGEVVENSGEKTHKDETTRKVVSLLRQVGLSDPDRRAKQYPHELSGGMCQRVVIAMALAKNPHLLIADEPTTALDTTVQAQIMQLLRELVKSTKMSIILITHNLALAAEISDRIIIMYAGEMVEKGSTLDVLREPLHPYTKGLLDAVPKSRSERGGNKLYEIPGMVPQPEKRGVGCLFAPRCFNAHDECFRMAPKLESIGMNGREIACFYPLSGNYE